MSDGHKGKKTKYFVYAPLSPLLPISFLQISRRFAIPLSFKAVAALAICRQEMGIKGDKSSQFCLQCTSLIWSTILSGKSVGEELTGGCCSLRCLGIWNSAQTMYYSCNLFGHILISKKYPKVVFTTLPGVWTAFFYRNFVFQPLSRFLICPSGYRQPGRQFSNCNDAALILLLLFLLFQLSLSRQCL